MTPELRAAYLDRLGVDAEPPSLDALQRLHRRHVQRVPYETMWLHAGEGWGIDPIDSVRRIAVGGRGGYCYHLNGAFSELLVSLGYEVTRHVGGVHGPDGPSAEAAGNHHVLTVDGLSTDDHPSGTWYVDVGLGDALHGPLPLVAGEYVQPPFSLVLEELGGEGAAEGEVAGDWHLVHDPSGGFVGMSWTVGRAEMAAFTATHAWLSTAADSPFRQVAMAERRDATGVDVVRGLVLVRIGDGASTSEPLTRDEWFDALGDLFDLRFDGTPPEVVDRLWATVRSAHEAWEAAGRP
jgi:arylamine N-acetyltransferase